MSRDVSVRELRNHTADVLRRVEAGERLRVTVDRRPVAELAPLPARDVWVPRDGGRSADTPGEAARGGGLDAAQPGTVDEG
jgi:prevent-host-death family protein